ncbi:MAG: cytochrome c maturation protein CcmE [Planctomycetes bacterium]|nr:cytochrome c maturation protein CcmE [Planctomycetota bacterium]
MFNLKIFAVIAIVVCGLGYLMYSGVNDNSQQYVTITELSHRAAAPADTIYKLKGKIVDGSVDYDAKIPCLRFDLNEGPGTPVVHVVSPELMPDNFKPGNECIVEGTFERATSSFAATKVMTKCTSKYEGQEEPKTASR